MRGDEVLLVERAAEPYKGHWGLPGGAVEVGEPVTDAVAREVAEETGLHVTVERLLGFQDAIERDALGRVRYHFIIFYFSARVTGGQLQAGEDAAQAVWVPLTDMNRLQVTDSVMRCLNWSGIQAG